MKKILLSIFAVMLAVFSVQAEGTWTLVKSVSDLAVGDKVVIAAAKSNYAMSTTQNSNNRAQAAITKTGDTMTFDSAVQELTLAAGKTAGTFAFNTGSGYLYAASSSKNYLRTEKTLSANSSWNITITSAGVATIKSTGSYTRNWLRYNSSNNPPIFSCYGSGQADVCLYKYVEETAGGDEVETTATPVITPAGGEITADTEITITCATAGAKIYYTTDGTEPTKASTLYTRPFTLTSAATVKAIAAADGLETSDVVTAEFTFPVVCENIAAFIANEDKENYATISGEVVVVAQSGKYLFVQDNSAKILVYGELGTEYNAGDRLTGIKGKYSPYNGLVEMVPDAESFGEATPGDAITPVAITLDKLSTTDLLTYVTISDVDVPAGSGKSYTVTDATGKATMYNTLGIEIPAGVGTITGFVSVFNTTRQLMPLVIEITEQAVDVAEPTFTPESGETFDESLEVTIEAEEGLTVYYSTDNKETYTEGKTLNITETTTVYAYAENADGDVSDIVSATYTKNAPVTPPAEGEATVEVNAKDYFGDATISISEIVEAPVTLTFAKNNGSTAPAYNKAGDCRIYAKGSITANCSDGNLTKIVFVVSDQGKKRITDLTPSTGTVTIADDHSTVTWEGNAAEVVLTVGDVSFGTENGKAGQICFTSFVATYTSGDVETSSHKLSVTAAGYATLFLDFNAAIPAGVEAYTVTAVNNGYVTLTPVEGVLPANTGIIVKANEDDYNFVASTGDAADVTGNLLSGTTKDTVIESAAYVLGIKDGIVGLYTATTNGYAEGTFLNNANKAYLPKSAGMNAASYSFRFGEGTTGISEVKTENGEMKTIYDLTGRKLKGENGNLKGIYIINGKKVLVK